MLKVSSDSSVRHGVKVGPGPRDLGTLGQGPGTPLKFKSGTLIIIFLHCLTYFVLDKHMYNMEIICHQ